LPARIQPPNGVAPVSTPAQVQTLVKELKHTGLATDIAYLAPEQIVAMAATELEQAHPWDSALLLNIASYRYQQEQELAWRFSMEELKYPLGGSSAVVRWRDLERRMLDTDLIREVLALRARLRVLPAAGALPPASEPSPGSPMDQSKGDDDPYRLGSADEHLAHPELAEAFLNRLLSDRGKGARSRSILETTPLVSFRRVALTGMKDFQAYGLMPDTQSQYAALRPDLLAALRSPQPPNRAAAAFVLGAVKDATATDALQAALGSERDPRVQISLRVALARLGDDSQLASLEQTAQVPDSVLSEHTLSLMDGLPKHLLARVQPGLVPRVLLNTKAPSAVRANAARLLKAVAEARPLSEPELAALLQVCGEGTAYQAEVACRTLGGLKQLSRTEVLRLLGQSPRATPGLVQRWAEVSERDDLAAIEGQFAAANSNAKRRNECKFWVKAVARIEGSAATKTLSDWYVETDDQLTALLIAAEWSRRADVTPAAREALRARVASPKRLFLSIAAGDPRTEEDAAPLMARRAVKELFGAAYLAGFDQVPGALAAPLLWKLASYQHPDAYPLDIGLRAQAVTTLAHLAINKLPAPPEP